MKWAVLFLILLSVFFFGRYSKDELSGAVELSYTEAEMPLEVGDSLNGADVKQLSAATDDDRLTRLLQNPNAWQRYVSMLAFVEELSEVECETAARLLSGRLDLPNADLLMKMILGRWAESDREAVIEFAVQLYESGTPSAQAVLLDQATEWARLDSSAVLEYADDLRGQVDLQGSLRYAVIFSMAEADPLQSLELYRSIESSSGSAMSGVLWQIIERVASVDLARAQLELEGASKPGQREVVGGLLAYYSKRDPEAGLAYAQTLPVGLIQPHDLTYPLMANWVQKSPDQALQALINLKPGDFQDQLFSNAISTWSHRDLDAAMDWVLPRIDEPLVKKAWGSLVYTLAQADPLRGMQIIDEHPSLKESRRALVSGWMSSDADSALAWVEEHLPPAERAAVLSASIYSVLNRDPMLAMRVVDAIPIGQQRDHALTRVAREVAKQDVTIALDWIRSQPEDMAQMTAMSLVMGEWADSEPILAAKYVMEQSEGNAQMQASLIKEVVGGWAKKDPAVALEWTTALQDDGQRAKAMESLVFSWSRTDFESAQTYVMRLPAGESRSDYVNTLVRAAVSDTPQHGIGFYDSLPVEERTDEALQSLVSSWSRGDPMGASEWVNQLPAGNERDVAAGELVGQISRQSPKDALPWALQIEDQKLRNKALENVASGASNLDSEIVRQCIDEMTTGEKRKAWFRKHYLKE